MMNGYFHNLLKLGGLRVKIKDISDGIRNVSIQGKIIDMNAFILFVVNCWATKTPYAGFTLLTFLLIDLINLYFFPYAFHPLLPI